MMLIPIVWKTEQCYSYNYTVAYRSINYRGLGAVSQDFPRLAINLEISKSVLHLRSTRPWWQKGLSNHS